jgi:uncharacterized membrane protein YedE/YeeE
VSYNEPPNYGTPPPPPGGGQPPYGGPPGGQPGYGQEPKNSVMAVIALVLGIIGVIPCFWGCGVFQIGAIVLGILGKKDVAESNGAKKGANLAQWGFILGIVGIVLAVIYWILWATTDIFTFEMN